MIYSRVAIVCGLLSTVFMCMALFGGSWLHCQERTILFNNDITDVSFRVGLWEVCPINDPNNSSDNYVFESKQCMRVTYNTWGIRGFNRLDAWYTLQFTPQFVNRMRIITPIAAIGFFLFSLATLCTLIGHYFIDSFLIFAGGFFILGGIQIGSGLLVFVSILSETYIEVISMDEIRNVKYTFGWSFVFAAAALAVAKTAMFFSVTSYMYKWDNVEETVGDMIPGADRRFRQHFSEERYIYTHELITLPVSFKDLEMGRFDVCETELHSTPPAATIVPISARSLNASSFNTFSGREPRYVVFPRQPAQFYSLPQRADHQETAFSTKSAV